jgi:drug/metabolite transporter (DMT)-like permease
MLGSFSVLIPMVWGIAVMGEKPSTLQYVALAILLSAILLVNADKFKPAKTDQKTNYGFWILFVAATFVCNGACSVLQKEYQNVSKESYSREFMFFAMLVYIIIPAIAESNSGDLICIVVYAFFLVISLITISVPIVRTTPTGRQIHALGTNPAKRNITKESAATVMA